MQRAMKTIPELANDLGLSRVAVYKKVKSGQIPATRVGRYYVISSQTAKSLSQQTINQQDLDWIDAAVKKVVQEYGTVFKWLSIE
jgi:excisionase family DNA binding protein